MNKYVLQPKSLPDRLSRTHGHPPDQNSPMFAPPTQFFIIRAMLRQLTGATIPFCGGQGQDPNDEELGGVHEREESRS